MDITRILNSFTIDILVRLSYDALEPRTISLTVSSASVDLGVLLIRKSVGGSQSQCEGTTPKG